MDYERAAEVASDFLEMLDRSHDAWNNGRADELRELDARIMERLSAVSEIGEATGRVFTGLNVVSGRGWRWTQVREACRLLRGHLSSEAEVAEIVGSSGPKVAAPELHPWIWTSAASLWDSGHRREAVQTAATHLELQIRAKVGRDDLAGASLMDQAFTLQPSQPPRLRLRHPGVAPGTADFRSLHEGALYFGKGCMLGIRNLVTHSLDQPSDRQALEYLAALSVLARWVDDMEPVLE